MFLLSNMLVLLVALLHIGFLVLEMFLWTHPIGMKVFRNTPEKAQMTRVLAANQGLYNGFLAAGLVWSQLVYSAFFAFDIKIFFLSCVVLAALFGTATVSRRILYVQGLPAIIALLMTMAFANPYIGLDCCARPQVAQLQVD